MAFGAIGQILSRNTRLLMAGFNLVRLVIVAAVTGVFGVLCRMARLTGHFAVSTVVQGEDVLF